MDQRRRLRNEFRERYSEELQAVAEAAPPVPDDALALLRGCGFPLRQQDREAAA